MLNPYLLADLEALIIEGADVVVYPNYSFLKVFVETFELIKKIDYNDSCPAD